MSDDILGSGSLIDGSGGDTDTSGDVDTGGIPGDADLGTSDVENPTTTSKASADEGGSDAQVPVGLKFSRFDVEKFPQLAQFKDADALAEAFIQAQTQAGLTPLPENASEADKLLFEQKLRTLTGVPESVEGYGTLGYPPEETKDNVTLSWFIGKAHEMGIPPIRAEKLAHEYDEFLAEVLDHHTNQRKSEIQQFRKEARDKLEAHYGGGAEYDKAMARARVAITKIGQGAGATKEETESFAKIFGDHPYVIRMFEHLGRSFTEQQMVFGTNATKDPTEYTEAAQIDHFASLGFPKG